MDAMGLVHLFKNLEASLWGFSTKLQGWTLPLGFFGVVLGGLGFFRQGKGVGNQKTCHTPGYSTGNLFGNGE